jgi:hypothetical protein
MNDSGCHCSRCDGTKTIAGLGFYYLKTGCGKMIMVCFECKDKFFRLQFTPCLGQELVHLDLKCNGCRTILLKEIDGQHDADRSDLLYL